MLLYLPGSPPTRAEEAASPGLRGSSFVESTHACKIQGTQLPGLALY